MMSMVVMFAWCDAITQSQLEQNARLIFTLNQ